MSDESGQIKLLIVDDEVKFLESISKRLSMKDFDVTAASDGRQAIKAAKGDKFDIAILDLRMPGMDGTEVLKVLKDRHKFLEVIILTGHASLDSAVETMKLGAFHYLEKPCTTEKLDQVLKEAYQTRLKKKFEHDTKRLEKIQTLSLGSSPMGILSALKHLDDDEK